MEKIRTIEEIVRLYDKNFNPWKIIVSDKNLLKDFIIKIVVSIGLVIPIILLIRFSSKNNISILFYSTPFVLSICLLLSSPYRKALKKMGFTIPPVFKPLDQIKLFEFKTQKLKQELLNIGFLQGSSKDIKIIDYMIELTIKESERHKKPIYILLTLLIPIFIPIFDNFLNWIYTKLVTTLKMAFAFFLITSVGAGMACYFLGLAIVLIGNLILNYKSNKYLELARIFENIKSDIIRIDKN